MREIGYDGGGVSEGIGTGRIRGLLDSIGDSMLRFILVMNAVLIVGFAVSPYKPLVVRSDSMEPALPVGSIVIAERVRDAAALRVGDIVTYKNPAVPFTITHRIVEIREEGVVTKGDNLEEADGVVKWEWVRYRIKLIFGE